MTEEEDVECVDSGITRRNFMKGAAAGAAFVAGGALLPRAANAQSAAPVRPALFSTVPGTGVPIKYSVDVAVAGSGQGGFMAAIAAAKAGARVIMVEKAHRTGGPARFCAGSIHTSGTTSYAQFAQLENGRFDPVLGNAFWNNYVTAYTWLKSLGAYFTINAAPALGGTYGGGPTAEPYPVRNGLYLNSLENIFHSAGGIILLKTRALQLLTDQTGTISGLRVQDPTGVFDILTRAVVLSTGGFFANQELVSRYIGPNAPYGTFMGHPYNMGDGILMAQQVGAALDGWMANGCMSPGPGFPCTNPMASVSDYEARLDQQNTNPGVGIGEYWLLNYQEPPPQLIWVNWNGQRFINEDNTNTMAGYHYYFYGNDFYNQPLAEAFAIYDNTAWQVWGPQLHTLTDIGPCSHAYSLGLLQQYGGVVLSANTLSDLANAIAALNPGYQGFNTANFLNTVNAYNAAVAANTTSTLSPPRTGNFSAIQTPPFYAVLHAFNRIETEGGLAINAKAEVLDMQRTPIPGLYATPPCANSGVSRYCGGVSWALTFGYIAGNSAANYVQTGVP